MAAHHVIFGTAGHVDHGKSALVLALTGTDPDRLAEEKAREMTIDLGFAFLSLPGLDEPAAIVDVPGHEMFVRNMVAGATGVDAAILVVAADEGVMPQTVEHLDVLRHLGLASGVIALTKRDKASPESLRVVTEEVAELVRGTFLEAARIIPVSARSGEGLDDLRAELARLAAAIRARSVEGIFRLPIDRVFTMRGAGTVITGTVISGALAVGENVVCLPQGRTLRVRGLQVHNRPVTGVSAGQRAAINLADAAKDELHRGEVLATPGSLAATMFVDARLALSPRAPHTVEHRTRVRIHHGTQEVMARVVLLDCETLAPGGSALVQLRLENPIAAVAGDRFVARAYSPMQVIGGGAVVDPHPPKRGRQADAQAVAQRESLPLNDLLVETLERAGARGVAVGRLRVLLALPEEELRSALHQAVAGGQAVSGRRDLWLAQTVVDETRVAIATALAAYHSAEPLRPYAPLNPLTAQVAPTAEARECFRLALEALAAAGTVELAGQRVRLSGHRPQWAGADAQARQRILEACLSRGVAGPSVEEIAAATRLSDKECRRLVGALVEAGELCALGDGLHLHPQIMARCRAAVTQFLTANGKLTVSQCRDLFGASRKYLLPLLERFDDEGLTARSGDYRTLRAHPR